MPTTDDAAAHPAVPTYPEVQALLRHLAEGSRASQGDAGAFWDLPLDSFLAVRIAGEPLVAPADRSACCDAPAPGRAGTRASRSALVRGLAGLPPFDGRRLPRLPFGGKAATREDIALVESWIEAGCPERAVEVPLDVRADDGGHATVQGPAGPTVGVVDDAGLYAYRAGEMRQRMDIDCMTPGQLERLRHAFRELYALNKWPEDARSYNNLALIHQNHCQHGWERFLPWHRVYLYEFEKGLQAVCPDVTMPYWDFSAEPYGPRPDGTMDESRKAIPDALATMLTHEGREVLERAELPPDELERLDPLLGQPYPTQAAFFRAVQKALDLNDGALKEYLAKWRNRYIDALLASNALWYPLRYPGQFGGSTINNTIHYHYPAGRDIAQIQALRTFRDYGGGSLYNDAFGFVDQNPHNTMHIWTGGKNPEFREADSPPPGSGDIAQNRNKAVQVSGRQFHRRDDLYQQPKYGDMFSNLTAAFDPVFWPVHANVDRLWWCWQQDHPHGLPADLDAVLTPWAYAVRDTLDMHRFGYEYVKKTWVAPVAAGTQPIGRFTSAPVAVPPQVRARFGRAEVRVHRVPQLLRSCFIRVFLNEPTADAETPLDRETYAGYLAVFGHGTCIGGPGHCTPQPPRLGRERDMNAPRNHRVDVTACAGRLIGRGATELTVTLVVIGADYREDRELLRLDGVSLTFLD